MVRNKLVSVVGVNPPADIASGRAHIVRWTMVLRRPKRSVDVVPMTAYEIITIFIGILALLMSFGSLIIAFLTFLDKRNNKKK